MLISSCRERLCSCACNLKITHVSFLQRLKLAPNREMKMKMPPFTVSWAIVCGMLGENFVFARYHIILPRVINNPKIPLTRRRLDQVTGRRGLNHCRDKDDIEMESVENRRDQTRREEMEKGLESQFFKGLILAKDRLKVPGGYYLNKAFYQLTIAA
jgi:hypothetical protein